MGGMSLSTQFPPSKRGGGRAECNRNLICVGFGASDFRVPLYITKVDVLDMSKVDVLNMSTVDVLSWRGRPSRKGDMVRLL